MKALQSIDRRTLTVAGIGLAVLLFLAINLFSSIALQRARVDLTEGKLYTLSRPTQQLLAGLKEPVTLRFYFSRSLADQIPAFGNYARRVRELLDHYVNVSNGMLRLKIYNPEPYSVEEDEAVTFGLQGVPLDRTGEVAYFGLAATNTTDDQQVIPFFNSDREPFLEYDITRLLFNLANPTKKRLAILTDIPIWGDPSRNAAPWGITDLLNQFFSVRLLTKDLVAIEEGTDVVLLVHPQDIPEKVLYALDQFVMRGGRLMVFVDPVAEIAAAGGGGQVPQPSRLDKLFAAWGIDYNPDFIAADGENALQVRLGSQMGGRETVADYLSWFRLGADNANPADVVTSQINRMAFASAGVLSHKEGAATEFIPLIRTSPRSMRMESRDVRFMPNPQALIEKFKPEGQPLTLAARVRGKVKSAFPDGPPPQTIEDKDKIPVGGTAADVKPLAPHLAESVESVNIVVVADTDMLADRMWFQQQDFFGQRVMVPTSNNADFVVNVLDNLSGTNALIDLRGRGFSVRPFEVIDQIQRQAEIRYRRTEQGLKEKLQETQRKLGELQLDRPGDSGAAVLTDEQRAAIANFRAEMVSIRQELRGVQHALRRDIEELNTALKIINIWAVPVLITLIAIAMAMLRRVRYRRFYRAT